MNKGIMFGLGLIFTLLFIVPMTDHMYGLDTARNYELSSDISEKGYVNWNNSFWTGIGVSPVSYPIGGLIILAMISQLTGISMETCILIISILINVFCFLLTFLIGKRMFENDIYALILAIVFTTSRIFISMTTWNYSVRPFIVLFALSIMLLMLRLLAKEEWDLKYTVLISVMLIAALFIHRLAPLVGIFVLGYFLTKFVSSLKFSKEKNFTIFLLLTIVAMFAVFYLIFNFPIVDETPVKSSGILEITWTVAFKYALYMGAAILFIIPAIINLLRKKSLNTYEIYILMCILVSIPILGNLIYTVPIILILLASLSVMGIQFILEYVKEKPVLTTLFVIVIVAFQILPFYVTVENRARAAEFSISLNDQDEATSRYIDSITPQRSTIFATDGDTNRVIFYSKNATPIGGNADLINNPAIIAYQKKESTREFNTSAKIIQTGRVKHLFSMPDPQFEGQEYYSGIDLEYLLGNNNQYLSWKVLDSKNTSLMLTTPNALSRKNSFFRSLKYSPNIYSNGKYYLIDIKR